MDLNFILNYWNNVDRHFFKKKIISIVLYCNYGFLVQHTHTLSPSIVIHFKKHEGVEIRSPRVIRSWSKRERWPVVEQGDPFSIEQPTLNVIFYTQWRLRWATWRDFINPNQTSLKPVSLVVPCFIFISRSLSLSFLLQLCSFPLITVRSTEKAARTVNWLFELSTPWMKRKREREKEL